MHHYRHHKSFGSALYHYRYRHNEIFLGALLVSALNGGSLAGRPL